jgi:hypothetical protein
LNKYGKGSEFGDSNSLGGYAFGQNDADPLNEYKDPFDNKDFYSDEFGSDHRQSIDQRLPTENPKPNIRIHRFGTNIPSQLEM